MTVRELIVHLLTETNLDAEVLTPDGERIVAATQMAGAVYLSDQLDDEKEWGI